MTARIRIFSLLGLALFAPSAWAGPEQVLVLANSANTNSVELALHYMAKRGIPDDQLVLLEMPDREEITRQEYNALIRLPLFDTLRTRKLADIVPVKNPFTDLRVRYEIRDSKIKYLVSMYGVPLRIADTRSKLRRAGEARLLNHGTLIRDVSAVDSELSMMLYSNYRLAGPHNNPYYDQYVVQHYPSGGSSILFATRIDGPSPADARRIIDDSVAMERYGLLGRVYIDTQGLKGGIYLAGDLWMQRAYFRFREAGLECVVDNGRHSWTRDYPMEDVAVYIGWYERKVNGPFLRKDFRFVPGAVAYHLHSFSALTLRSATEDWAGPLIARGAAATMGHVEEPHLQYSPNLNIFSDRLCRTHYTFGEAAYMSMAGLSWQNTVVGDPLYQPLKYSAEEQVKHLLADGHPGLDWGYLRIVNGFLLDDRFNLAIDFCRRRLVETQSLVLREKLADLFTRNDIFAEAVAEFEIIVDQAATAETAVRNGMKAIRLLQLHKRRNEALQVDAAVRKKWPGHPCLRYLDRVWPKATPPTAQPEPKPAPQPPAAKKPEPQPPAPEPESETPALKPEPQPPPPSPSNPEPGTRNPEP